MKRPKLLIQFPERPALERDTIAWVRDGRGRVIGWLCRDGRIAWK